MIRRTGRQGMGCVLAAMLWAVPDQGHAFDVSNPAAVGPVIEMTAGNWVGLRPWEGAELLYFTHLESWRCAMREVRYAINGGAEVVWEMPPCMTGTPSPNALPEGRLPFMKLNAEMLRSLRVVVVMSDGTTFMTEYPREAIMLQ